MSSISSSWTITIEVSILFFNLKIISLKNGILLSNAKQAPKNIVRDRIGELLLDSMIDQWQQNL
jgi:hypothetical protein